MKQFFVLIFISSLLFSCDDNKAPQQFNLYGAADRRNSYEHIGRFDRDYVHVININAQDKSGAIVPPLSLEKYELVVATEEGSIILLDTKGPKWEYSLNGDYVITGMAADKDKNVYALTNRGKIISISYKGDKRWESNVEGFNKDTLAPYSDFLALQDGFVTASQAGLIIKYSYEGKKLWSRKHSLSPLHVFAADDNGNLAVPLTHDDYGKTDSLLYLNSNGKLKWAKGFTKKRLIKMCCISKGKIFVPAVHKENETSLSVVYEIDSTGKITWEKKLSLMPRYISIANNGDIFVAGFNVGLGESYSGIYAFDKNHKLLWSTPFNGGTVSVPLLISEDEAALVLSTYNGLGVFFIDIKSGGINKSLPLSEAPPVYQQPAVVEGGVVMFVGSQELKLIELPGKAF